MSKFITLERVKRVESNEKKVYYIPLGNIAVRKENIISLAEETHYDGYFLNDVASEEEFKSFVFLKVLYKTTDDKIEELLVVNNMLDDVLVELN